MRGFTRPARGRGRLSPADERSQPRGGDAAFRNTAWARSVETPLRVFLRTETGSAAILVVMTDAALEWITAGPASCAMVSHTRLSLRLGSAGGGPGAARVGRGSAHLGIARRRQ